jgi:DNA repair exonuclease SbcCD nuclease subunit
VFNCVKRVFESFISVGIKVFAIPGNHDQVSNQDRPENSLYGLGDTIVVVDTMCNFDVGDVSVVWIPFTKNKQIVLKYLKEVSKQNSDKPRLLVSHLGVVGGAMGKSNYVHAGEYEVKQLKPNYFCAVVLGHYHKPQFLTDNMIYAGAPIQHNFNDEGEERGYWILDIRSNKKVVFNLYSIDSPKFITKEYHKDIQLDSGDYIRMVVDEKNIDKAVNSIEESNHFVKLELTKKVSVERRIDIDVTASNEVILGRYVENFGEGDKELLLIGKSIYEEANI